MVTIAGGEGGPIAPGEPSCKMSWEELRVEQPEVIVLMPCGFPPDRAAADSAALWHLDGWSELPAVQAGEVYCTDGNAYFSRPGPRLVEGIEILARALHGDAWAQPVPEGSLLKLAGVSSGGPEYTLVA
jgi:iron complex transport system substrate-binding protein